MQRPLELPSIPASTPPVWRRLFHVGAAGAIPLLAIFVSGDMMVFVLGSLVGPGVVLEMARLQLPGLNRWLVRWLRPLLKETESHSVTGATYVGVAALVAFFVFDKPVAIVALFFLALGDPAAALVGRRAGGYRIMGKSPWGSLAFFLVAMGVAGVLSGAGVVSFHWGLVVGAAVAALVELSPSFVDDNLTIPLISGGVMTLLSV